MPLTDIEPQIAQILAADVGPIRPTCYVLWGPNVEPEVRLSRACHADLRYEDANCYDELVTRTGDQTPQNTKYLGALLTGPFKNYAHLVDIHEGYVHVRELDKWPANVLFNFCIASRYGVEFPKWIKKLGDKPDPVMALWQDVKVGDTPRHFSPNHCWFDYKSVLDNILLGTMNNLSGFYKKDPYQSIPTNIIWSKQIEP